MSYNLYSEEWNKIQQMLPMIAGLLEMFSGLSRDKSWDINPLLDIIKYNRQDRPFATIDSSVYRQALNAFNQNTSVSGKPSESNAEMMGRALFDYFGNGRGDAERALRVVLESTGAGVYAFGTGGRSVADAVSGNAFRGKGGFNTNLTNLLADVYGMETDPSVNKGQRQMLLAGMIEANKGLVEDYANAKYDKEKKAGDSAEALAQMLDKTRKSLEGFGEAATSWGRVLNTDAVKAMEKLQDLLGGSAFGAFYGRENKLAEMGYDMRHVTAMTGHDTKYGMAMVQQAGTLLKETGGPADTAVQVANATMIQSFGMAGYRVTQEQADKMMLRYNANLQNSEAAAVYFGGFSEFVRQVRQSGDPEKANMSFDELADAWNKQIMSEGGVTVAHANRILNTTYGVSDFAMFSKDNFARDLAQGPNGFTVASWRQMREDVFDKLKDVNPALSKANVEALSARAKRDVIGMVNLNENAFMEEVKKIEDLDVRQEVIQFRTLWERGVRTASANGELGIFSGQTPNAIASMMTEERARMIEEIDRQRQLRSKISGSINGASMSKTVIDYIAANPNFTLGDLAVAAGTEDIDARGLDALQMLQTTKDDMETLMGNISSEDKRGMWAFRGDVDRFLRKVKNGVDVQEAADVLKPYGVNIKSDTLRGDFVHQLSALAKAGDTDEIMNILKNTKFQVTGKFEKIDKDALDAMSQKLSEISGEAKASQLNDVFSQFEVTVRDSAESIHASVTQVSKQELDKSLKAREAEYKEYAADKERLLKTYEIGRKDKKAEMSTLEKMELSSYQAMMDLARDYLADGGANAATQQAAKEYLNLFSKDANTASIDEVKKAFSKLKETELGDELMQKQVGYLSQMGVTMDQAGMARVLNEVFKQTFEQISTVIKDGAVDVNVIKQGN